MHMKRKREMDNLSDMFAGLSCSKPAQKAQKVCSALQIRKCNHTDRFSVGKVNLDDRLYAKHEVEQILEDREAILYAKFIEFVNKTITDGALSADKAIPRWVV